MIKNIYAIILLIVSTSIFSQNIPNMPNLTITTEEWKPFQFMENGELKGISVEVMDRMLKVLGSSQTKDDIKILPWSRAYSRALQDKNTVLFLTAKTKERENLFKWVGPVLSYHSYLIARKDKKIVINKIEDLNKYRIGSVKDDASELFLMNLGVKLEDMVRGKKGSDVVTILSKGRIDILLSEWTSFLSDIESVRLNINDYEPIFLASTSEVYYAFNLKTSDGVVDDFQHAFDIIKESGELNDIFKIYGEELIEGDIIK